VKQVHWLMINCLLDRGLDLLTSQLVQVRGQSMLPPITPGSWVRVSRRSYWGNSPARFDIVRFFDPMSPNLWAVKRIIGLPGEWVSLDGHGLKVNGWFVEEPHIQTVLTQETGPIGEWWTGKYEYILIGDNRAASTDSRHYGPVHRSAISGKVASSFYPSCNHRAASIA